MQVTVSLLAAIAGLSTALPEGVVIPAGSILNGPAWVDQTYGSGLGAGGNVCGDTRDVVNRADEDAAPLAPDCMEVLNKVKDEPKLVFHAERDEWDEKTQAVGFYPLITVGTCSFTIRPTEWDPARYNYFVGYQDVADILHDLINKFQIKKGDNYRFGASGIMPCTDRIKQQRDYTLEFKVWNPTKG
ncbi:hypothetical protein JX266_005530 [Neoarthrinium moseri]|uniref:uncharacterized protein n=1 Tax=Neoarthrinium moseri TaxID=1658444 RepID=UPI001FDCAC64|nr:uncharacterized protein JN550_008442 [Neoarthrinium moseri]KAI1848671.1 hypothetical protein JX266_005530 [Neoarthrinium moseri]KAI1865394.1 hypothetical protein JN550_008442 [Neoarthrinium moseri]